MLEAVSAVLRWHAAGRRVVLATLVRVEGSAPRDPGAMLAVNDAGEIAGSISSGCIEADIVERAERLMSGSLADIVTYREAGPFSLDVGLTCGGGVDVLIAPIARADDLWMQGAVDAVEGRASSIRVETLVVAGVPSRSRVVDDAERTTDAPQASVVGGERFFAQSFGVRPEMIVFGAVDFSRAVATIGRFLGYRVTVVDARARFATHERFPDADEIVVAWPDEYLRNRRIAADTALVVLTHDERFDIPLLVVALESEAAYVGVMGNRATHARRLAALRELGIAEDVLARMHAPIGLDIGARTPEAVAISIAAEIIAKGSGRRGGSLRESASPISGLERARV